MKGRHSIEMSGVRGLSPRSAPGDLDALERGGVRRVSSPTAAHLSPIRGLGCAQAGDETEGCRTRTGKGYRSCSASYPLPEQHLSVGTLPIGDSNGESDHSEQLKAVHGGTPRVQWLNTAVSGAITKSSYWRSK
jgi:hypothetical protein